jgi:hypothetical protein
MKISIEAWAEILSDFRESQSYNQPTEEIWNRLIHPTTSVISINSDDFGKIRIPELSLIFSPYDNSIGAYLYEYFFRLKHQARLYKEEIAHQSLLSPIEESAIQFSLYGPAINYQNDFYIYRDNSLFQVRPLPNIPISKYLRKIPVSPKELTPNDIIIQNNNPVFVTSATQYYDFSTETKQPINFQTNIFDFKYIIKINSTLDPGNPSPDYPFGSSIISIINEGVRK